MQNNRPLPNTNQTTILSFRYVAWISLVLAVSFAFADLPVGAWIFICATFISGGISMGYQLREQQQIEQFFSEISQQQNTYHPALQHFLSGHLTNQNTADQPENAQALAQSESSGSDSELELALSTDDILIGFNTAEESQTVQTNGTDLELSDENDTDSDNDILLTINPS